MLPPSRCTAIKRNGKPCTSSFGCCWISGDSRSTDPSKQRYVCTAHWKNPTGKYQGEEPIKKVVVDEKDDDSHPQIAFYAKDE